MLPTTSSTASPATLAAAVHQALTEALTDAAVVILAEALDDPSLADLPADRVIGVPIADRGTLGLAVGLALAGRRPVVQLAGPARLAEVMGVLAEAGAIAMGGEFAVPVVVRLPYGAEAEALDVPAGRYLADLPGIRVVCASSPAAGADLLRRALEVRGPTVILEPRRLGPVPNGVPLADARLLRQGTHVTLATWGGGVAACATAAEALAADGVSADVLELVSLAPLDHATLGDRVRRTGRLVVVHPDDPHLARHVRQVGLEEAFLYLEAPLGIAPAAPGAVASAAMAAITY